MAGCGEVQCKMCCRAGAPVTAVHESLFAGREGGEGLGWVSGGLIVHAFCAGICKVKSRMLGSWRLHRRSLVQRLSL